MYKLFILGRLPVSVVLLCGYATGMQLRVVDFGAIPNFGLMMAPLIYLLVVTIKLYRSELRAQGYAWGLLLLEFAGGLLLLQGGDYLKFGKVESWRAALTVAGLGLLWVLPNALLFYKWRGKFVSQEKKAPGA